MLPWRVGARDGLMVLVAVAAASTAVWLFVQHGSFVLTRLASPDVGMHLDFDTFWRSAVALLDGRDIYRTGAAYANLNPPLLTVLMAPFGLLGFFPAYRLFVLVTVVLFVGSMAAVAVELRLRPGPATAATTAALVSSPVLATLGLGQIYALLTAGMTVCWVAGRRGHPVVEGVALGLVVAVKPSLLPVLLLPGLRRSWTTLGAATATGLLATVGATLMAGVGSFPEWLRLVLHTPVQTYFDNASLPATVVRLTSVNDWGRPILEVPGGYAIGSLLGIGMVAATLWRVRRADPPGGPDTALWALTAASLLVSPLTWHNYLMILMPGLLVLLTLDRWPAVVLLLALGMVGMEWPPIWYVDGSASALPLSLYCAVLVTYWATLTSGARSRPAEPSPVLVPAPSAASLPAPTAVIAAAGSGDEFRAPPWS